MLTTLQLALQYVYFTLSKVMFKLPKGTSYFMDLQSCPILISHKENRMSLITHLGLQNMVFHSLQRMTFKDSHSTVEY